MELKKMNEVLIEACEHAMTSLMKNDSALMNVDVYEPCISGRFAMYLRDELLFLEEYGITIDPEYNKFGEKEKHFIADDETTKTIRPDVIVHRRGSEKKDNYLYCEIKKHNTEYGTDKDKVELQVEDKGYNLGLYIYSITPTEIKYGIFSNITKEWIWKTCSDYYNKYVELQNNILNAYKDIFSLSAIEDLLKIGFFATSSQFFSAHICELLKKDLCLTIWKLYYDKNPKANTLNSFKKQYMKTKCIPTTVIPTSVKNAIIILRKQYIAHNDKEKTITRLFVSDLHNTLSQLKDVLNALCDKNIDKRVEILTDQQIDELEAKIGLDIAFILKRLNNL